MFEQVVLRTFNYRHEAELFRSILESEGIAATVGADDEGALHPAMGMMRGVCLRVAAEDAARAAAVLDAAQSEPPAGDPLA